MMLSSYAIYIITSFNPYIVPNVPFLYNTPVEITQGFFKGCVGRYQHLEPLELKKTLSVKGGITILKGLYYDIELTSCPALTHVGGEHIGADFLFNSVQFEQILE